MLRGHENKKAEVTSRQIVIIIILIISFVILLFFFLRLNLKGETDKEICKNSVLLRGAIPGDFGKAVSLKCKTSYLCLSKGSKCANAAAEKISVADKEDIKQQFADSMYDCWWMLGAGEVDLGPGWIAKGSCFICSVLYFDSEVQDEIKEIESLEIYEDLQQRKVPGSSKSYLYYLYKTNSALDALEGKEQSVDTSKSYAIVAAPKKPENSDIRFIPYKSENLNEFKKQFGCEFESLL